VQNSITNSCAIDSLYQLFLAATVDYPLIREFISEESENNCFFNLLKNSLKAQKVIAKLYSLSALTLVEAMGIELTKGLIKEIDAVTNVTNLYETIFKRFPSMIKECPGCAKKISVVSVMLDDTHIFDPEFHNTAIEKLLQSAPSECRKCNNMWALC